MSETPATDSSSQAKSPQVTRRGFLRAGALGAGAVAAAGVLPLTAPDDAQAAVTPDAEGWKDCIFDFNMGSGKTFKKDGNEFDFEFHQSWFSPQKSFTYNPYLARFALAMATSAFGVADDLVEFKKYPDQSQAPYAQQAANLEHFFGQLHRDGYTNDTYRHNNDLVNPTAHDTIGLGACTITIPAWDETTYTGSQVTYKRTNVVLLAIRGGNYFLEWCGNLEAGKSGDHEGFTTAAKKTIAFLKGYIKEIGLKGRTKILISGFSRASATANMTGGLLLREAEEQGLDYDNASDQRGEKCDRGFNLSKLFGDDVEVYQSDLFVYGFEVPRGLLPGSSPLDDKINARPHGFQGIHSLVNPCDPVTYVMPTAWKFWTFGVNHRLPGPTSPSYGDYKDLVAERLKGLYKCGFANPGDDMRIRQTPLDSYLPVLIDDVANDLVGSRDDYYDLFQQLGVDFMQELTKNTFSFGNVMSKWGDKVKDHYLDILKNITWRTSKWLLLFPPAYVAYVLGRISAELVNQVTDLYSGELANMFVDMFCDALLESVSCDNQNTEGIQAVAQIRELLHANMHFDGRNPFLRALNFILKHPTYLMISIVKIDWLTTWITKQIFGSTDIITGDLLTIDFGHLFHAHEVLLAAAWLEAECEKGSAPQALSLEEAAAAGALASVEDDGIMALSDGDGNIASVGEYDSKPTEQLTETYRVVSIVGGDLVRYLKTTENFYTLFDGAKRVEDNETTQAIDGSFSYVMNGDGEKTIVMGGEDVFKFYVATDEEFSVCLMVFDAVSGKKVGTASFRDVNSDGVGAYVLKVNAGSLEVRDISASGKTGDVVSVTPLTDTGRYVTTIATDNSADKYYGVVVGGGTTQAGTYELLAAVPVEGYEFDHWTVDGKSLGKTPGYAHIDDDKCARSSHFQHYVDGNHTIKAHFRSYTEIGADGGAGQSIAAGTAKELAFSCGAAAADFLQVEVNEVELAADCYTVSGNGEKTVVTLKAAYVASLAKGEHKVAIISSTGAAATKLIVTAKGADGGSTMPDQGGDDEADGGSGSGTDKKGKGVVPSTGDSGLGAGVAAAAVAGVAAVATSTALGDYEVADED